MNEITIDNKLVEELESRYFLRDDPNKIIAFTFSKRNDALHEKIINITPYTAITFEYDELYGHVDLDRAVIGDDINDVVYGNQFVKEISKETFEGIEIYAKKIRSDNRCRQNEYNEKQKNLGIEWKLI